MIDFDCVVLDIEDLVFLINFSEFSMTFVELFLLLMVAKVGLSFMATIFYRNITKYGVNLGALIAVDWCVTYAMIHGMKTKFSHHMIMES